MTKYKIGDKLKITHCEYGHEFKIGQIVIIDELGGHYDPGMKCYDINKKEWWYVHPEECDKLSANYANLHRSKNGTFYYTLHSANGKNIGTNRGINRKADAIKTLKNCFPDFQIIDKTNNHAHV